MKQRMVAILLATMIVAAACSASAELPKSSDLAGIYAGEGVNFTLAPHPQYPGNRMIGMLINGVDKKVSAVTIRIDEKGLSGIVYDGSLDNQKPFTFKVDADVLTFMYKDGTTLQLTRIRNAQGK